MSDFVLGSAMIFLDRPAATPNLFILSNPHTRGEFAFDELGIASTVVQRREELENKQKTDYRTPESSVGFRKGGQRWLLSKKK